MDRNRMIFLSIISVSIALSVGFIVGGACFIYSIKHRTDLVINHNQIKSKELEIGVYDQLTYCIKTVMKESRDNGKPTDIGSAKEICAKFNKVD